MSRDVLLAMAGFAAVIAVGVWVGAASGPDPAATAPSTADTGEVSAQLGELQAEIAELQDELAGLRHQLDAAVGELASRSRLEDTLRGQIASRDESLRALEEDRQRLEAELRHVQYALSPIEFGWETASRRDCVTRIYGTIVEGPGDVSVGPVRLLGARSYADVEPGTTFKVIVVVEGRHEALLVVPPELAGEISLDYAGYTHPADAGTQAIVLPGCDNGLTMYSGGFDVSGPTCAAVDVAIDGSLEPTRVWLPYAVSDCP